MGIVRIVSDQIGRSRDRIRASGWDASRYGRHYVTPEDLASLASDLVKGVPPHIARTKKITVMDVEVRAMEVLGPEGK